MKRSDFIASLCNDYRIISELSNKNDCRVLRLRNSRLSKDIIVKEYSDPVSAYDVLKSVSHKNLPLVYDTLHLDDGQIVLEEFINGITVAEVLENGKYTYRGAVKVITEVCYALSALHSFGIIHRDIKPENIMIAANGEVKLIDLNASRRIDPRKTKDTVVLGTIGYASPEQMGISQCDEKTDIFALGVLLNVMLTGEHPSKQIAKGKAGRIVAKCTHIDPQSRFASVEKLVNVL